MTDSSWLDDIERRVTEEALLAPTTDNPIGSLSITGINAISRLAMLADSYRDRINSLTALLRAMNSQHALMLESLKRKESELTAARAAVKERDSVDVVWTVPANNKWRDAVLAVADRLPDTGRQPTEDDGPRAWTEWLVNSIDQIQREIFRPVEWPPTDSGPVSIQILVDGFYENGQWCTNDTGRPPSYFLTLDTSIISGWRLSEEAPTEASHD